MIFEMVVAGVVIGTFPTMPKCNTEAMIAAHYKSLEPPKEGKGLAQDSGDWVVRFEGQEIFRAHCREGNE